MSLLVACASAYPPADDRPAQEGSPSAKRSGEDQVTAAFGIRGMAGPSACTEAAAVSIQ